MGLGNMWVGNDWPGRGQGSELHGTPWNQAVLGELLGVGGGVGNEIKGTKHTGMPAAGCAQRGAGDWAGT